ncbi:ribose-5-phosphate isomerase A [Ketogulonicigenium robustum]|uniref:Ribose-5-phosphate isomerase A n=1 Tax=Ketogulonicigenium robustum TaxID=92947 RepID=A0A1W6NXS5_9RHOB|nr:ribose-5-phosphate isomerase RpiA [Ketogulonicigenium robustum]ARO13963.1 ribose-5-phosphate isomerase A [Ketogulonicigenium robustum]
MTTFFPADFAPAGLSPVEMAKFASARRASAFVESGMRVGLGTGSTAAWLVKCLGHMVRAEGLQIRAVPTSERTAQQARAEGIEVVSLQDVGWLDLTIDGADEFDPALNLIKGGGGAHLREKIVATASDRMIVITDPSKQVATLGMFPLPVEIVPFGWQATRQLIEESLLGVDVGARKSTLRMNGTQPFTTDEGNLIIDLHLGRIGNARQLSLVLNQIAGVVENGLFVDICDTVVIGHPDGRDEVIDLIPDLESLVDAGGEDNIFKDIAD